MSNYIYDEILDQAQRLTFEDQLRLIEDLVANIRRQEFSSKKHSVMEFRGLGKELWKGVHVEKYIDEERNSWER